MYLTFIVENIQRKLIIALYTTRACHILTPMYLTIESMMEDIRQVIDINQKAFNKYENLQYSLTDANVCFIISPEMTMRQRRRCKQNMLQNTIVHKNRRNTSMEKSKLSSIICLSIIIYRHKQSGDDNKCLHI